MKFVPSLWIVPADALIQWKIQWIIQPYALLNECQTAVRQGAAACKVQSARSKKGRERPQFVGGRAATNPLRSYPRYGVAPALDGSEISMHSARQNTCKF